MEAANNQSRKRARSDEDNTQSNKRERYQFHDGIGVFDFPWLKEGVVFEDHDDNFAYLDTTFAADCHQNLSVSPPDDATFLSLPVDDLEPLDRIWSCVIDQPLLDVGSTKG